LNFTSIKFGNLVIGGYVVAIGSNDEDVLYITAW